jgi:hypothetical protein
MLVPVEHVEHEECPVVMTPLRCHLSLNTGITRPALAWWYTFVVVNILSVPKYLEVLEGKYIKHTIKKYQKIKEIKK